MNKIDKPYLFSTFSNAAIGAFLAIIFTIDAADNLLKYYFFKQTILSIFTFIIVSWPFEKTVINKANKLIYDPNSIKSIYIITIGSIIFLNLISINNNLFHTKLIMIISILSGIGLSLSSTIYSLKKKYFYAAILLLILRIPDLYLGLSPNSFNNIYPIIQLLLLLCSILILIKNRNKLSFNNKKMEKKRLAYFRILSIFLELIAYTLISQIDSINSSLRISLLINTILSSTSNILTPSIISRKNDYNLEYLKSILNSSYFCNFFIFIIITGKKEFYYSFLCLKLFVYFSSLRVKKIYKLLLVFCLFYFFFTYIKIIPLNFIIALVLLTISSIMQPLTLNKVKN
tara:strand:- start:1417 stop:2448 length:1032 start_codon:yes stop_codon:yes gene_type:complete